MGICFQREDDRLISEGITPVGFVSLRDSGTSGAHASPSFGFRYTAGDSHVGPERVAQLLHSPADVIRTGITAPLHAFLSLQLWLAIRNRQSCSLAKLEDDATPAGLLPQALVFKPDSETFGLVTSSELCLVGLPPGATAGWETPCEICLYPYGSGKDLCRRLLDEITAWDQSGRGQNRKKRIVLTPKPRESVYCLEMGEFSCVVEW